jgi:hypothetical protein
MYDLIKDRNSYEFVDSHNIMNRRRHLFIHVLDVYEISDHKQV